VRSKSKGDVLYIDISDNGGGVKREEAATIFDKFSRGHRSNIDHGAGLGLSISRAIVRSMGGNLTLEFADDETSFFRLRLPRSLAPEGAGD
ncbi:MAG TPA: ATP-binding protein, partial [Gammaproteobacteria bacterium]|nr:ATP-binding protein [Gammaproteobacteria bacterium]